MIPFLLRRILIMIPTLLGISLVTLGLIHLAPGDPVQMQLEGAMGKGTISPEEIEAMRRTYYLHLPLLFNPRPEDAAVLNETLAADLLQTDGNKRERSVRKLVLRGMVAVPAALTALEKASGPAEAEIRASVLAGLEKIAVRTGQEEALKGAADPVAFWKQTLAKRPADPTPQINSALAGWNGAGPVPDAIVKLDTLALAPLIAKALSMGPMDSAAIPVTAALSHITGVELTIQEADPVDSRIRMLDDWRRWWGPRRTDYVTLSGAAALTSVVTETQYAKWLKRLVTLDFDRSSRDNIPIRKKLGERLNVTLTLALLSLFVSYLIAIPIGVYSAVKQYSVMDRISTMVLFMLYSLPSFWVAMLLQQYLCGVDASGLSLFPLIGLMSPNFETLSTFEKLKDMAWHLILPIGVLTYRSLASLSRFQRVGMLDVIRQDFVRTARAKGLPERTVILKHALRNSLMPVVTLIGLHLPALVGGAVIVESIFQINGMGLETLEAIRTRDMNWIMASVSLTALMTMGGILLSDVLYALVDPRIQVGQKGGH